MGAEVPLLIIFILVLAGSVLTLYLILKNQRKALEGPMIEVWDTSNTDGRTCGVVIDTKPARDGRIIYSFIPTDVSPGDYKKDEIQKIITKPEYTIISSKGSWSKGRTKIIVLPDDLDGIPKNFDRKSMIPIFTTIDKINEIEKKYQILKEQNERLTNLAIEMGNGEWSEEFQQRMIGLATNVLKLNDDAGKKKSSLPEYPNRM